MSDGFGVTIRGLKEVDAALELIGGVASERIMKRVMYAALKPMQEKVSADLAAIPTGSGALHKATRRVFIKSNKYTIGGGSRSVFVVAVAPKTRDKVATALANLKYKRKYRGVFWGHLMEWGHRIGNKKTGRLTRAGTAKGLKRTRLHQGAGRVPGKKIFTNAASAKAQQCIDIFAKKIFEEVNKARVKQGVDAGSGPLKRL